MKANTSDGPSGCLALIIYVVVSISIGGWCFAYILETVFGKDIPWYADALAGLVLSSLCVPGAIVCWIITLCGVPTPFIH